MVMLSMIILLNPFPTEQSLSKTSTAVMDPQHLKMEVAMEVPNCSYVIKRTCQYLMLIMSIKSIKNWENIRHESMKIKIQVLFQFSFVILCSTHGSLQNFECNLSAMGKETNSSLDTFTEQTIFDFLLTIFSHHRNTKFAMLWNI